MTNIALCCTLPLHVLERMKLQLVTRPNSTLPLHALERMKLQLVTRPTACNSLRVCRVHHSTSTLTSFQDVHAHLLLTNARDAHTHLLLTNARDAHTHLLLTNARDAHTHLLLTNARDAHQHPGSLQRSLASTGRRERRGKGATAPRDTSCSARVAMARTFRTFHHSSRVSTRRQTFLRQGGHRTLTLQQNHASRAGVERAGFGAVLQTTHECSRTLTAGPRSPPHTHTHTHTHTRTHTHTHTHTRTRTLLSSSLTAPSPAPPPPQFL
jgi:hypothetical protein